MAKVQNNVLVRGIKGSIGEVVFRVMPDGKTYVSGKPDFSSRKFSKGQKNHQSRFKEAAAYARQAARRQPIYAQLAVGTIQSPYNWALSDWFHPPVIHSIERKEGAYESTPRTTCWWRRWSCPFWMRRKMWWKKGKRSKVRAIGGRLFVVQKERSLQRRGIWRGIG